jgi:hypothetical protein
LLRNLRGFPPKVSLSAAHSRFASASRHRTAFLLQGDFLWLQLRRRGLERAVYTTPLGIADAAKKYLPFAGG